MSSLSKSLSGTQSNYGGEHLLVLARAGTGKTHLLCSAVRRLWNLPDTIKPSDQQEAIYDFLCRGDRPKKIRYMAFSKKLEQELQAKVPSGVIVKNFHGTGYGILRDYYGRDAVTLDNNCTHQRAAQVLGLDPRRKKAPDYWMIRAVKEMVHWMKLNLLTFSEDDLESEPVEVIRVMDDILEENEVYLLDQKKKMEVYQAALRTLDVCRGMSEGKIDFDDMIYLPVIQNLPVQQVDLGLVDEAQDLTPVTQAMAKRLARRLVVVGDDRQMIYRFAGAKDNGMETFRKELECERQQGCAVYPLSVTYRCPQQVVELARQWVPDYSAHENNRKGQIYQYQDTYSVCRRVRRILGSERGLGGVLVLARSNYILVQEFLEWMGEGIHCKISSMRVAEMAQEFANQQSSDNEQLNVTELLRRVDVARNNMHQQLFVGLPSVEGEVLDEEVERRRDEMLQRILREDTRFDVLESLLEQVPGTTSSDGWVRWVENMETGAAVEFSTIHKAKGMECGHVVLLEENNPSSRKEVTPEIRRQRQREMENLLYVAVTRSSDMLYLSEVDERINIPPTVDTSTLS